MRLPAAEEEELLRLLDDLRGLDADYLARVKAEQLVEEMLKGESPNAVYYLVQLLDDPQWDVRAATWRLIIKYGKHCPDAVAALVQLLGDMSMSAPLRDHAARALRAWTGRDFAYGAWDPEEVVRDRAGRWKSWLDETGGVIPMVP